MEKYVRSFNLINEKWIPLLDGSLISLFDAFSLKEHQNIFSQISVESISIFKLLQVISMAACPVSDKAYKNLSIESFSEKCIEYLNKHKDAFDIYHPTKPFLQFPQIKNKTKQIFPFNVFSIDRVGGWQKKATNSNMFNLSIDDAQIARLLLLQQGFCRGTKKFDSSLSLSKTYTKAKTASTGTNQGRKGFLHSFVFGSTLLETLFINLFTTNEIDQMSQFSSGLGVPVWEQMPISENCPIAQRLQNSLIGRLTPMNRFCYIHQDKGMELIEGVLLSDYKEGGFDPSSTIILVYKEAVIDDYKVIETKTNNVAWRSFEPILSFLDSKELTAINTQVRLGLNHAKLHNLQSAEIVSHGLKINFNSGEQYISQDDDNVCLTLKIDPSVINHQYYQNLKNTLVDVEKIIQRTKVSFANYYMALGLSKDTAYLRADFKIKNLLKKIEDSYQKISDSCINNEEDRLAERRGVKKMMISTALSSYELAQPIKASSLKHWVKNKPFFNELLSGDFLDKSAYLTPKSNDLYESDVAINTAISAPKFVSAIGDFVENNEVQSRVLHHCHREAVNLKALTIFNQMGFSIDNSIDNSIMTTIGLAIKSGKTPKNGLVNIITALHLVLGESSNLHFRRLISCSSTIDLCRMINRLIPLMNNKNIRFDYIQLMNDLLTHKEDTHKLHVRWTEIFYRNLIQARDGG
jgi:CRISPR system Cascade subunit CasA